MKHRTAEQQQQQLHVVFSLQIRSRAEVRPGESRARRVWSPICSTVAPSWEPLFVYGPQRLTVSLPLPSNNNQPLRRSGFHSKCLCTLLRSNEGTSKHLPLPLSCITTIRALTFSSNIWEHHRRVFCCFSICSPCILSEWADKRASVSVQRWAQVKVTWQLWGVPRVWFLLKGSILLNKDALLSSATSVEMPPPATLHKKNLWIFFHCKYETDAQSSFAGNLKRWSKIRWMHLSLFSEASHSERWIFEWFPLAVVHVNHRSTDIQTEAFFHPRSHSLLDIKNVAGLRFYFSDPEKWFLSPPKAPEQNQSESKSQEVS